MKRFQCIDELNMSDITDVGEITMLHLHREYQFSVYNGEKVLRVFRSGDTLELLYRTHLVELRHAIIERTKG